MWLISGHMRGFYSGLKSAGKPPRGDEQFVRGWALPRQRGCRGQVHDGKVA